MSEWHVVHDPNDGWYHNRIYDDDTLILNVVANGSAGKAMTEQIVREHNDHARLLAENAALRAAADIGLRFARTVQRRGCREVYCTGRGCLATAAVEAAVQIDAALATGASTAGED